MKISAKQGMVLGGIILAFIGTFLTWASLDASKDVIKGIESFGGETSASGLEFGAGKFILFLAIVALVLFAASTQLALFPEKVQLALMGAPIIYAILGILAVLALLINTVSGDNYGSANVLGETLSSERSFGLWLTWIGALLWTVVSVMEAIPLIKMAQAMKASQQTPPPAAPPAPPAGGGFDGPPAPPTV